MNAKTNVEACQLLLNDARGVYIPQNFCEIMQLDKFTGIDDDDVKICLKGPHDNEQYWDAWQAITDDAEYTDEHGNVFHLYQDGDLWLLCPELMTKEERKNFGFDDEDDEDEDELDLTPDRVDPEF